MNFSNIVGALLQAGMAPSTNKRVGNAFGAGGKASGDPLSGMLGGLGDVLSGVLGGGQGGGGGGIGGMLSDVLGDVGRSGGGKKNLAVGGLGALAGALFGGGGGSVKGALGGGAMALLSAMAFSALKGAGEKPAQVPMGLLEPETPEQEQQLEDEAELVLKAMINAAKSDGRIDQTEVQRILGQLEEAGANQEVRDYLMAEVKKPMDLRGIVSAAGNRPELGAQLYAASLLAIEVDTPAERTYLQDLATGLNVHPQVVAQLEKTVGLG